MAIEIYELYESRRVNVSSDRQAATLEFFGRGSTDDAEMRAAFELAIPTSFLTILLTDVEIRPLGGGVWLATAEYGSVTTPTTPGQGGSPPPPGPPPPPPPPAAPAPTDPVPPGYAVDISMVTEKVLQAKATVHRVKIGGGFAPDTKNAIGVTKDGKVEGCERMTPKVEFSVTRRFGYITTNYIRTLTRIAGTTNDSVFYGFQPNEVLFVGASLATKDLMSVEVTCRFWVGKNETDIEICPDLVVPNKDAWDYLVVSYMDAIEGTELTMQPDYAYVYRIYDESDFADIGIGE